MKKKKLIFFTYNLGIGGIESALINLLHMIDYQKYDVTLILEKREGALLSRVPNSVHIKVYSPSNHKNKLIRKITNLAKRIVFTIKNYHKYDFSCSYATYSVPGSVLAKIASKNSSLYVHSSYEYVFKKDEEYVSFFEKLGVSKFNHIFFVSNESRQYFNEEFKSLEQKTLTLNNFINETEIIEKSKSKIKEIKRKEILFVFVGRLVEESKRVTKLINLIEYLKDKYSIECWIIGDGPDRRLYENLVKEKKLELVITFFGMQTNPYPYMNKADYLILTSDYEGFPVVYNEGIILGKKIITTMDVRDDYISIPQRFGYVISKEMDKMKQEVSEILEHDNLNCEKISYKEINQDKIKRLEKIFNNEGELNVN